MAELWTKIMLDPASVDVERLSDEDLLPLFRKLLAIVGGDPKKMAEGEEGSPGRRVFDEVKRRADRQRNE